MNWTWIYIAALYAAAVWLARRGGVDLPRRVAVFFFALVLVFFLKPLTMDYVHTQDDVLNTLPPWHFVVQNREAINVEMNDIPLQHTVWGHQVREKWKSLTPPLWNEFNGSGYPLLANGQSSAMSPIRLLGLPLPVNRFMAGEAAMKILIALTFTFLFIRGRGYSELAAVIGAVIFGFGGFLHSWLHFPHITTACFLPAVLWLIDQIAERRTFGRFAAAAVVWASIVYGGHPETASHIFFLALLYIAWIVFVEKRTSWRLFLTLGGAMTVAAMLAAPFLLPFLEALPKSMRYRALEVKPYAPEDLPYADLGSLTVAFQAHFFGEVPFEKPWGPAVAEPVGGFAGVLGVAGFFALLVSVIRRRAWRSTEFFFVLATVVVFGVIDGWPLLGEAIHAVLPVVAHARFRLLFVLLLAVQAAVAVDLTLRGERKAMLAGVVIVAAMLVGLFQIYEFPDPAKFMTALATTLRSVAVLVVVVVLATIPKWQKYSLLALIVVVICELWPVTRGWNPPLPAEAMYPHTPYTRALVALKEKHRPSSFRVAGIGPVMYPNINAMYGMEEVRAHDPMAYDRYMGFVRLTSGYDTEAYHPWLENHEASVWDYLNVHYLLLDPYFRAPDPERWEKIVDGSDGRIYRNRRALPRFFAVRNVIMEFNDDNFFRRLREHDEWAQTAILDALKVESQTMHDDFFNPRPEDSPLAMTTIVSSAPTDYTIKTDAPRWSLVVSSIPWWPGWKVVRNGETVDPIRVNGAFLGFAVPPGQSDVHVYYSPWTWWVGVSLAFVAILGLIVAGWKTRANTPA